MRERGQAVTEFALVLPLLMLILLALMQLGLLLNARQILADVARVGVRTYALTADPVATYEAVVVSARQLSAARSMTFIVSAERPGSSNSAYNYLSGDAQMTTPRGPGGRRGEWVSVSVTYQYPNPIQASVGGFRLPPTIALTEAATARLEMDASR